MFDPVTLGAISGGIGTSLGLVQRVLTMSHEFKLKALAVREKRFKIDEKEARLQDELQQKAFKRQRGAKWIVRGLVGSVMFAVVFATWINGFFDVPSFVEIEQTGGFFRRLFGPSEYSKIVEIKGFFLSQEVQNIASMIAHFYLGARVGSRKL